MLGITLSVLVWLKLAPDNGAFVEMGEVRVWNDCPNRVSRVSVAKAVTLTDGCGEKGMEGWRGSELLMGVSSLTHRPFLRVTLLPSLQNRNSDASTTFAKSFERLVSLLQMLRKI